jgi:hypothetical protein
MAHQHSHTYRFTHAAKASSIVGAFDAMPVTQPSVIFGCPVMIPGMPVLTLRFVSGAGTTLARAQVNVHVGSEGGSGSTTCDPIDFWIGTRRQTPLTSHTFVKQIAKLIGANIS